MNHKLDIPIGVSTEINGRHVECVKTIMPCDKCAFEQEDCRHIACYANEREDRNYVIFKELKV